MPSATHVRPGTIDEARAIHARIPEFDPGYLDVFDERTRGVESLILIAEAEAVPAGYMIGYARDAAFYCWMTGVEPAFRGRGLLGAMMAAFFDHARASGYRRVTLKTRNARREMLAFVVAKGFDFLAVDAKENPKENDISLAIEI